MATGRFPKAIIQLLTEATPGRYRAPSCGGYGLSTQFQKYIRVGLVVVLWLIRHEVVTHGAQSDKEKEVWFWLT